MTKLRPGSLKWGRPGLFGKEKKLQSAIDFRKTRGMSEIVPTLNQAGECAQKGERLSGKQAHERHHTSFNGSGSDFNLGITCQWICGIWLSKGLSRNNLTISHPIFGSSLNASQSKKPQHSPGYVSAFPQSFRPNLTQIWARNCEGDFLTGPKSSELIFPTSKISVNASPTRRTSSMSSVRSSRVNWNSYHAMVLIRTVQPAKNWSSNT